MSRLICDCFGRANYLLVDECLGHFILVGEALEQFLKVGETLENFLLVDECPWKLPIG